MSRLRNIYLAIAAAAVFTSTVLPASSARFDFSPKASLFQSGVLLVARKGGNGGHQSYSCEGLQCTCQGDADCNDMFSDGVCGDIASCSDDICKCLKFKKVGKTPKVPKVGGDLKVQ